MVCKQEKICNLGIKRAEKWTGAMPKLQNRQAYGNPIKKNQEEIHGLL